ncbi:hypothetical protein EE612_047128, partial [Oryza sativa]
VTSRLHTPGATAHGDADGDAPPRSARGQA